MGKYVGFSVQLGSVEAWWEHQSEHCLLFVLEHKFGHRARVRALAQGVSTRAPCLGMGTSLNRFSSVPAVFAFSQESKIVAISR